MNKPTSPMAQFLYAVNDAILNAVNWYSTNYHMAGKDKSKFIINLNSALNKAINDGNDEKFRSQYKNLMELLNYTSRWGEETNNQKLLKIKHTVEEKRKDIIDNRVSLINFNQITQIINTCSNNDISNSIDGQYCNKLYHVSVNKTDIGISIAITCNDERGLEINYTTGCDASKRFYRAILGFRYYHYSSDKAITFTAGINVLSQEDFEDDITHILSELVIPYDANGKVTSWNIVSKCKDFMFDQSELQFIINMLNDTIGTKDDQDDTKKIKKEKK